MNSSAHRISCLALILGVAVSFPACRTTPPAGTPEDLEGSDNAATAGLTAPPGASTSTPDALAVAPETTPLNQRIEPSGDMKLLPLAYPTGDKKTSTVLLERSIPEEVLANKPFDYEIRVTNLTLLELTRVIVTDRIPETLRIVDSNPKSRPTASGEVQWGLGSIAAGATKVITVTGTSEKTGPLTARTTVDYDVLLSTTMAVVAPKLSLKMNLPEETLFESTFPLVLSISNEGVGPARDIQVTYEQPLEGYTLLQGNLSPVPVLKEGETFIFPQRLLRAEKQGSFTHKVRALATLINGRVVAPRVEYSMLVTRPELQTEISGAEEWYLNHPSTQKVTVKNTGDGVAKNAVATYPIPEHARVVGKSPGGVESGGVVTWKLGALGPGESRTVEVRVSYSEIHESIVRANAEADAAEPTTVTAKFTVVGIVDLDVEVRKPRAPLTVRQEETFTIRVRSLGSAAPTNIGVVCKLDEHLQYVRSTAPGGISPEPSDGGKTLTFPPLASLVSGAGKSTAWRVVVRGAKSGLASFRAEVVCDGVRDPQTKNVNLQILD